MSNLNWNRPVHRINKENKVLGPKLPELPVVEYKMTFAVPKDKEILQQYQKL